MFQRLKQNVDQIHSFWQQSPALAYGVALSLGIAFATASALNFTLLAAAFYLPICLKRKGYQQTCLCFLITIAGILIAPRPLITQKPLEGSAYFVPQNIVMTGHGKHRVLKVKGTIKEFTTDSGWRVCHLPCSIVIKDLKKAPSFDTDYRLKGKLIPISPHNAFFKMDPKSRFEPIVGTKNYAHIRQKWHTSLFKHLQKYYQKPHTLSLCSALILGHYDDSLLQAIFIRSGLLHVLAISGFHFAIVAYLLKTSLSFLPRLFSTFILIALLCLYLFFLGPSPSVMRAYFMTMVVTCGYLFKRDSFSLNTLGLALFFSLLIQPRWLGHLGFQFSFLITASLLFFTPYFEKKLKPVKVANQELSLWGKHLLLFKSVLSKPLALTLAVNLTAIPLSLLFWHKFPLMALFLNFIYPTLLGLCQALLMIALLIGTFCKPLAHLIHNFNQTLMSSLLHSLDRLPHSLDFALRCPPIPSFLLILYFISLFSLGILLRKKHQTKFIF